MNKKIEDYPQLERLATEGYEFHFSDYISKGFDIFKQDIGGFVGYTLLYFVIAGAASFIPGASALISPALVAGFAIVAYNIVRKQHQEFGEFFKGFDHFVQLLLVTIVSGLIMFAILVPFGLTAFLATDVFSYGEFNPDAISGGILAIGILVIMIPIIYLGVAWSWAPFFVIFHKMQFWDAMETSRKIITKNWWILFGFMFVTGLIAGLGILGLIIGIVFTLPAFYCMQYVAFAEVVGLHSDNENPLNRLEDHLVG